MDLDHIRHDQEKHPVKFVEIQEEFERKRPRNLKIKFIPGWDEDFVYNLIVTNNAELKDVQFATSKAFKYIFSKKCKKFGILNCDLSLQSDIFIINKRRERISPKTILGDLMDSGDNILYVHKNIYEPVHITFYIFYPDDPNEKYNYVHKNIYTDDSTITNFIEEVIKLYYYKNNPKYNLMNIVPENNNYNSQKTLQEYADKDGNVILVGKIQFRTTKQLKKIQDEKELQEKQQLVDEVVDYSNFVQKEEYKYQNTSLYDIEFILEEDINLFNIKFSTFLYLYNNEDITFSENKKEPVKLKYWVLKSSESQETNEPTKKLKKSKKKGKGKKKKH